MITAATYANTKAVSDGNTKAATYAYNKAAFFASATTKAATYLSATN